MDVACPAKHPALEAPHPSPGASVDRGLSRELQPHPGGLLLKYLIYLSLLRIREVPQGDLGLAGLPGINECIAGAGPPGVDPQPCPWRNRPWTLPLSDSTRETPVVMSTSSRSPRSTFLHWV